jgi:hypothetical protein
MYTLYLYDLSGWNKAKILKFTPKISIVSGSFRHCFVLFVSIIKALFEKLSLRVCKYAIIFLK